MQDYIDIEQIHPIHRTSDHGGNGTILFRRLLQKEEFVSAIDFVDYTIIPAKCSIGTHKHNSSEEIYFIVSGRPLVAINGVEKRLRPGSVSVVRSGQTHGLVNDSDSDVIIFVIQVSIT